MLLMANRTFTVLPEYAMLMSGRLESIIEDLEADRPGLEDEGQLMHYGVCIDRLSKTINEVIAMMNVRA